MSERDAAAADAEARLEAAESMLARIALGDVEPTPEVLGGLVALVQATRRRLRTLTGR